MGVLQLKTKELEQQLAEMKLKQQQELTAQEQTKSSLYNEKLTLKLKIEQDLRAQLAHYGDKFEQFQASPCSLHLLDFASFHGVTKTF